MRLLRLTTMPEAYLTNFYRERPGLDGLSVAEQVATVFEDHFAQSDSYSVALAKRGYDCHEAVVNLSPVLRMWADRASRRRPAREVVQQFALSEVRRIRPDILWLNDYTLFDTAWIKAVRDALPGRLKIYSWCGVKPEAVADLSGPNCILTASQQLAGTFRAAGLQVAVIPFAFDPRVLTRMSQPPRAPQGLSFVGSVRRADGFHDTRARIIEALDSSLGIAVYSPNGVDGPLRRFAATIASGTRSVLGAFGVGMQQDRARHPLLRRVLRLAGEKRHGDTHPVWRTVRPAAYGLNMYEILRNSLVTLNVHAECAGEMTGNIRLFEATGVGTCLLTDAKRDVADFFEPDSEVVTFSSPAECVAKAKWLLDNSKEAIRIGQAGQARTLSAHTYDHRAEMLDALFRMDSAA